MPTFLVNVSAGRIPVVVTARTAEAAENAAVNAVAKKLGISDDDISADYTERCLTTKEDQDD